MLRYISATLFLYAESKVSKEIAMEFYKIFIFKIIEHIHKLFYILKKNEVKSHTLILLILLLFINDILIAKEYNSEIDFTVRYSDTYLGDISATGAPVLCAKTKNGNKCNWNYTGYLYDITPKTLYEGDTQYFVKNSSSAILQLPNDINGSNIEWAGLYWQGHIFGLGNQSNFDNAIKDYNKITLMDPNGNIYNLNASETHYYGYSEHPVSGKNKKGYRFFYQGFTDITNIVKNSLGFSLDKRKFIVGNINTTLTKDTYFIKDKKLGNYVKWGNWGGWSIIVAYKDNNSSFKNIALYDGFKFLLPKFGGPPESLTISLPQNSFYTPQYGQVKSKTIIFAAGAERKINRDKLEIYHKTNGWMTISNNLNPADNQINDTISYLDNDLNPTRDFNPGMDLDTFNTSGMLDNAQTTTSLRVTMQAENNKADQAFVGFIGISNDIYQPKICYIETLYDSNGSEINPSSNIQVGDEIKVHLLIRNDDNATAEDLKVVKIFDENKTKYVQNSTIIKDADWNDYTHFNDNQTHNGVNVTYSNKNLTIGVLGEGTTSTIFKPYSLSSDIAYIDYNFTIQTDQSINFIYNGSYTFTIAGQQFIFDSSLPKCYDFNNTITPYRPDLGSFNVVHYPSNITTIDPLDINDFKNALYTQIVNKDFNVVVTHVGNDNKTLKSTTGVVFLDIVDASSTQDPANATIIYELHYPVYFDSENMKTVTNVKIPVITKNATFRIKYMNWNQVISNSGIPCADTSNMSSNLPGVPACLDSGNHLEDVFPGNPCRGSSSGAPCLPQNHGTGTKPPYDHTYGCAECLIDYHPFYVLARDNFAVRPFAFKVFGTNQYKRAGEDFNLTIKAIDENNDTITSGISDNIVGISNYNESTSILNITSQLYSPSPADIAQMQTDTGEINVTGCPNAGTFTINNTNFSNGETNATLNYSETGILDVNVSEKAGYEFAKVDEDDTNDSQRYIKPAIKIYDKSDISKNNILLFIPYSFTTTANYSTTNGKNWLYINDINKSNSTFTTPKMAAYLTYTIKAYNKNNILTKNYTKTCFPDVDEINCPRVNGLKLNTTFDLFLDMDINSTTNANLSLYSEDNASSTIWTYTKNQSILPGQNSVREWISPKQFENGVGQAKVYFNIDRNVSTSVNPITITVYDVNTSTSWMSNPGSPKDFNGTVLESNKTFFYGRVHAPDYSAENNTTINNAKIYYEVYCKNCDKSQYLSLGKESVDDVYWYTNQDHNSVNDGNITGFPNSPTATPSHLLGITSNSGIASGAENHIITYLGSSYPYKERIEINASSWLIYNPYNETEKYNYFNVDFSTIGGWAGIGNPGNTVDLNMSKKNSKRIEW